MTPMIDEKVLSDKLSNVKYENDDVVLKHCVSAPMSGTSSNGSGFVHSMSTSQLSSDVLSTEVNTEAGQQSAEMDDGINAVVAPTSTKLKHSFSLNDAGSTNSKPLELTGKLGSKLHSW